MIVNLIHVNKIVSGPSLAFLFSSSTPPSPPPTFRKIVWIRTRKISVLQLTCKSTPGQNLSRHGHKLYSVIYLASIYVVKRLESEKWALAYWPVQGRKFPCLVFCCHLITIVITENVAVFCSIPSGVRFTFRRHSVPDYMFT